MSDRTYLGRSMQRFTSAPQFDGFSKVTIVVNDEIEYSAGTGTGRTLRITNPWGTPQMAQDILNDIRGFQYQPYTAEDAIIDPAAELGDGVTANNVYGGIYTQKIRFGPLLTATVAAPEDEELNHEYPYQSKPNKEITREAKMLRSEMRIQADKIELEVSERKAAVEQLTAQLKVQAGLIEAKVNKTGGSASSFEWNMTDTFMLWKANGTKIFNLDKNGAEVYGKIVAKSGKIGGFDILSNYLSYNSQTWGGTNRTGVYIGIQGIQCGASETGVRITNDGRLFAEYGEFRGSIRAKNIQYGGNDGYFSGAGITGGSISGGYYGQIAGNTLSTHNLVGGINSSLGRADAAYNVTHGNVQASALSAYTLAGQIGNITTLNVSDINFGNVSFYTGSIKDGNGNIQRVVMW